MNAPPVSLRMLVTDFDGTLLQRDGRIGASNIQLLTEMGRHGIVRVIATGRSLYSLGKVVNISGLPFEYIIFSTGLGVLEISSGKIFLERGMQEGEVYRTARRLVSLGVSFMLQDPVPDNHYFSYHEHHPLQADFIHRKEIYQGFGRKLTSIEGITTASQFIAMPRDMAEFDLIARELEALNIIRTTSPLDHRTLWMEIFPADVSKGQAVSKLAALLEISTSEIAALGNDYNDLDMLEMAGHSFVTANAPDELRSRYTALCDHDDDVIRDLVAHLEAGNRM